MKIASSLAFVQAMQAGVIHPEDGQLAMAFIAKYSVIGQLDEITMNKYYATLRTFLTHIHCNYKKRVNELNELDILQIINAFQTVMGDVKVWGDETRPGKWGIFRRFYEHLAETLPVNTKALVMIQKYRCRKHPNSQRKVDVLTYEEQMKMVDAGSLHERALCGVLFRGGARNGEIQGMKVKHVSVEEKTGIVSIYIEQSKTVQRTIYLVDWSAQILTRWLQLHPEWHNPEAPLFIDPWGRTLHDKSIKYMLVRLAEKAGVEKPRLYAHLCRHSAATAKVEEGYTEAELEAEFGWAKDSRTSAIYRHNNSRLAREAAIRGFERRQAMKDDFVHLPSDRY